MHVASDSHFALHAAGFPVNSRFFHSWPDPAEHHPTPFSDMESVVLAHVGVLLAMKTLLFDVIVIVSETSLTPAVPVANAVTGTMTNLR